MLILAIVALAAAPVPPVDPAGRASVELVLDREGRVTTCRVTRSSGAVDTDNAACRALRSRRFTPATDANGKRIGSTIAIADVVIPPTR